MEVSQPKPPTCIVVLMDHQLPADWRWSLHVSTRKPWVTQFTRIHENSRASIKTQAKTRHYWHFRPGLSVAL